METTARLGLKIMIHSIAPDSSPLLLVMDRSALLGFRR